MLLYDGCSYAFQWDLNISVVVPKAIEGQDIEFSFSQDENTATTKAYLKNDLIVADIPNFLLKRNGFLNVYHILEDENGNRTIWRCQLRILKKEKPDDYPGSWEEEREWDSLNKRVTELEKNQVQDTDTQYKLEANSNNARKFYLYSKEKDDTTWNTTPVSTITIPASTLATGTSNGTVKFNGEDIAVKGLGSAAYEANTAFDKAGAASAVLGTPGDITSITTVYGAKAAATESASKAEQAQKIAQSVRDDADAGKFNGVQGPQGDRGAEG